ncbi:MAG: (2,3-dihydroxybenzoyl)adenylate synthase [Streptomycetales bacterium]
MLEGFTPWPAELAARYRRAGYWQGDTLGGLLHAWAERYGERTAVVCGSRRVSYRRLDEEADRLTAWLRGRGLRPGDHVVVQLPNTVEFVTLSFALFRLGALPVFALPAHRRHEIRYFCEFTAATAYVVPADHPKFDYLALADEVQRDVASLRQVITAEEVGRHAGVPAEDAAGEVAPDEDTPGVRRRHSAPLPEDVAFFLLSGGTTGLPKLIPRTHDDYSYNLRASGEVCGFTAATVYLAALPVAHNFPLGCPGVLGTLHAGGTAVLAPDPSPATVFPLIERERVTVTAAVPALAIRWMEAAQNATQSTAQNAPQNAAYDLSSLSLLQVGGAKLNPEVAVRVRPHLGCAVQQVFGMAEGLLNYTHPDDPEDAVLGTQGRPMSEGDEIRVVDDAGRPLPDGELGELHVRGPYTIRGYYRAPEHNARAFTADGFYRTGDVVRRRPDGNLVVEGRAKDLINRGGEKISAEEIENLLLAHPGVGQVAVVAMPDRELGERVCTYVVPLQVAPRTGIDLPALVAHLRDQGVAAFKLPERLEVVGELPVTAVGKVDKAALRRDIEAKVGKGGEVDKAAGEREPS